MKKLNVLFIILLSFVLLALPVMAAEVSEEPNPVDIKPYYLQYTNEQGVTVLYTYKSSSTSMYTYRYINNYNMYILKDGKWELRYEDISSRGMDIKNFTLTNYCTNDSSMLRFCGENSSFGALITGSGEVPPLSAPFVGDLTAFTILIVSTMKVITMTASLVLSLIICVTLLPRLLRFLAR